MRKQEQWIVILCIFIFKKIIALVSGTEPNLFFSAEIPTRPLESLLSSQNVLIQCCGYMYTNYSPVGTCNPGINRASFSIKRSCSTPALRMDLVIPPGPGPTSQTWAFFSSPACFTILSARHKEHTKSLFSRRSSSPR